MWCQAVFLALLQAHPQEDARTAKLPHLHETSVDIQLLQLLQLWKQLTRRPRVMALLRQSLLPQVQHAALHMVALADKLRSGLLLPAQLAGLHWMLCSCAGTLAAVVGDVQLWQQQMQAGGEQQMAPPVPQPEATREHVLRAAEHLSGELLSGQLCVTVSATEQQWRVASVLTDVLKLLYCVTNGKGLSAAELAGRLRVHELLVLDLGLDLPQSDDDDYEDFPGWAEISMTQRRKRLSELQAVRDEAAVLLSASARALLQAKQAHQAEGQSGEPGLEAGRQVEAQQQQQEREFGAWRLDAHRLWALLNYPVGNCCCGGDVLDDSVWTAFMRHSNVGHLSADAGTTSPLDQAVAGHPVLCVACLL